MMENKDHSSDHKKKWVAPEIRVISGLDSCVEFLYGTGGNPIGEDGGPPPAKLP